MVSRLRSHVTLELELTPKWWLRCTANLGGSAEAAPARAVHAQAVAIAFELGEGVMLLKTKRRKFIARVHVPVDTSLVVLCEKAGVIVDRLNALDVGALPGKS